MSPLYKLQALIFYIPDLSFRQKDAPIKCEGHNVRGNLPSVLFRLERQDDLVISVGDKLEGGETVGRIKYTHSADFDVVEIWRAAKDEVRASSLVRRLFVALAARTARKEKPAL